ncbi:MAG: HEPN domain-containing protein, partial [Victivallaceae bacterium]|nr:HEPN domain-containing protein [Victivallaceae bacterium]
QDELRRIVEIVRKRCRDVEMVILFGSYARGDYREERDLEPNRKSGHRSDYDVLVVTGEKAVATDSGLWQEVTRECDSAGFSAYVRFITHDIQELNIKLAQGQYFYSDVRKEGCLLYDSGNFKLARKRTLKPDEKQRIARNYFDHWFGRAKEAYAGFFDSLKRNHYKWAAFSLHQAVEHSYKTVLLVFTNHTPQEHLLGILGNMAAKHDSSLKNIFPRETREEQERFELLDYAYIGARYDPDYRISEAELKALSEPVMRLLDLTENICKRKIKSLTK